MRSEASVTAAVGSAVATAPVRERRALRLGLDRVEVALLGVMGLLSLWVAGSDLVQQLSGPWVWTHTDGFFCVDQLQYLAWIQSSARHVLISNLFVLRPTPADYFQPAIIISGQLVRAGVPAWLSLMLWKPVAVVGFFAAARAASNHWFERAVDRRAALTLGLLFASVTVIYGALGVIGDMMPMWQSWGYPFGLMAVALIVFGLLGYARARADARVVWAPGLLGGLAGTLHPWQGELMVLVILCAELWRVPETRRRWRARGGFARWRHPEIALPVLTLVLVGVPLLYYFSLGHLDEVWDLAQQASKHSFSASAILIGAAPLGIVALLGYRGRPRDDFELLIRMWVPATVVLYVLSATALGATPLHAVNGITIPLALLAVSGVRRTPALRRLAHGRAIAWALIALGTIPANIYTMASAHQFIHQSEGNANFISPGERDALRWLHDSPIPGGVLTQFYLGEGLPGLTGRKVNVGNCIWSEPDCNGRGLAADALFQGQMSAAQARRYVSGSGARFVLANCEPENVDLTGTLGPLVVATHRFGCAVIYQLSTPSPVHGELALRSAPTPVVRR